MTPIVGDIIHEAGEIIGKFIPDADKRIEAQIELTKIADNAMARETQLLQGQIEINKIEAANPNIFVSGWRPFIGWAAGFLLVYTFALAPAMKELFNLTEIPVVSPELFVQVLFGVLGIGGGLRTLEKIKGVASSAKAPTPVVTSATTAPVVVSKGIAGTIGAWFK